MKCNNLRLPAYQHRPTLPVNTTRLPELPGQRLQQEPLFLSVIIPAHNAAEHLPHCLTALAASDYPAWECWVIDDHSADATAAIAQTFQAHVIPAPTGQRGPAAARNLGAQYAHGQVLLFLDADVCVRPTTLAQAARCLRENPDHVACFGSYDAVPHAPNFLSQYKNLQHHYVHQQSDEEATTFWTGCGAIYRQVFLQLGGLSTNYMRPSIEDIEFGYRLRAAGYRIRLDKTLQVTHRKVWAWRSWLITDVRDRALPWARLIISQGRREETLNLQPTQRLSVAAIWLALISLGTALLNPLGVLSALSALAAAIALNRAFYAFLARQCGRLFALGAILCHWLYFLYSGLAYAYAWLEVCRLRLATPAGIGQQASW